MVLGAISIIGAALYKYIKDMDNDNTESTMIYKIHKRGGRITDRYIEDKSIRIWNLYQDEIDRYNLKIINDYLVEAPCVYVNHPYLWKTLIPLENYDQIVEKAVRNEEIKLISALGAKRIRVRHYELQGSKFDVQIDAKTADDIIAAGLMPKRKI